MPDTSEPGLGRLLLLVLGAIVLVPLVMMALAVPMMGTMGWWWGGHTMGANPVWGLLLVLVNLLVLAALGYLFVRAVAGTVHRQDPALEELRRAYARGELTDEEFEERRDRLERD